MDADWTEALERLQSSEQRSPTTTKYSAPDDMWTVAFVQNVVDGDTVDLVVDLPCVGRLLVYRARLLGINAPETHTKNAEEKRAGIASADFLRSLIQGRAVVTHIMKADMYGRLLVHLYTQELYTRETDGEEDGVLSSFLSLIRRPVQRRRLVSVNTSMVQSGHAVEYDGKSRREPWSAAGSV